MTFVEALGGHNGETLMEKLGGHNGDMLHEVMAKKEVTIADNPLAAIAMDFDISDLTDLFGKKASDLQENMAVDNASGQVTGTSKYVTGYTGFSSKKAEQKGNFCVFHIAVGSLVIGTSVTVKVNGVTLDPDGLFVMRFKDGSKTARAVVTAEKDGHPTYQKEFIFNKVVRQAAS